MWEKGKIKMFETEIKKQKSFHNKINWGKGTSGTFRIKSKAAGRGYPFYLILAAAFFMLFTSCSVNKMAAKMMSESLSGAQTVFTSDDDPELIGDALPLVLKLYEVLLDSDPENDGLCSTAGESFITYSNIYIHTPAGMLEYSEWEKQAKMYERAKKMYLRGSSYALRSIDIRHKGFAQALYENRVEERFEDLEEEDVKDLYWYGMGIMGALSIDVTDPHIAPMRKNAVTLLEKGFEINSSFNQGAFHDFFMQYYASLPEGMGGGLDIAEGHFKKAVELSEGKKASPYVSYAVNVCTKKDDEKQSGVKEFKNVLEKALSIDENEVPENRLENIIFKRKAQWLLDNIGDYFLID